MKNINKMTIEELQKEYLAGIEQTEEEELDGWKQVVSEQRLDNLNFNPIIFMALTPLILVMEAIEKITGKEFFKEEV